MDNFALMSNKLLFKNVVSGPAPIGRILNYIYKAGSEHLYHQNGYRKTNLNDNIGYAWTTEYCIGLGLMEIGPQISEKKYLLKLTDKGTKIYELIKETPILFNEGTSKEDMPIIREEIQSVDDLYEELHYVFVESVPFAILKTFLDKNGYEYVSRNEFMDDFFDYAQNIYDSNAIPVDRSSRTPTSRNRVPSLLQLCDLFNMIDETKEALFFKEASIKTARPFLGSYLHKAEQRTELIKKDISFIVNKYGEDGTLVVESVVRNSALQRMFKHNLLVSMKKCIMCGMENEELLIGSHIRPAAISSATEKCDLENGLLLCCNHDKLFDRYLITFDCNDGHIMVSKSLSKEDIERLALNIQYVLPKELLTKRRKVFLKQHNEEFMNKEMER